jgi:hypothetical protein
MSLLHSPSIVKDGLVLCLDAASPKSYAGSGTTWFDRSGNGNNGTLVNGVGYNAANGGSLVFDGVNDYVDIPFVGNMSNTDYTVSILANHNLTNPARTTFWGFSENDDNAFETFCFQTWNNNINEIMFFNGNGSSYQSQIFTPQNLDTKKFNEYTFIILMSGNISLYINGKLYNTWISNTLRNSNNITKIWLGQRNTNNQLLQGNIAFFKIYNKALSPAEVLQNYNATKSRFNLL